MLRYHINVFWSGEDGCWIADVPDLEYCSAHGMTPSSAVQQVEIAVTAWLQAALAAGKSVPEPRYVPPATV
jgi:predicted RNase H-like HicB family nuclease